MRPLSPIRSTSPFNRPKITFNYPPSPLRQRPINLLAQQSPISPNKLPCTSNYQPQMCAQNAGFIPEADKCKNCQNMATYKQPDFQEKFCSNCVIQQMRNGVSVVRIELKEHAFYKNFHLKNGKENGIRYERRSQLVGQVGEKEQRSARYSEMETTFRPNSLERLICEAEAVKNDMHLLLQKLQSKEFASEGIKAIYKQKKLNLKNHYEKIKATIKNSIEKDLLELEKREVQSMKCLQGIKEDLSHGIYDVERLKHEFRQKNVGIQENEDLSTEANDKIAELKGKRKTAAQIVEQLSAFKQGQPAHSDSLHVRYTQEQIQSLRNQLYDPLTYTLLSGKSHQQETLFSFEQKTNPNV